MDTLGTMPGELPQEIVAQDIAGLRRKPWTQGSFFCHSPYFAETNLWVCTNPALHLHWVMGGSWNFTQHLHSEPRNVFTNELLKAIYKCPCSNYQNPAGSGWSTWTVLPGQCSSSIILHPSSKCAWQVWDQLGSLLLLLVLGEEHLEVTMWNRIKLSE